MGTYSKPGLTAGEAALISDPAAALLKAIGKVSGAFNTQMANIQISKEALAKSTAELNQQANSIKTDQGNTLASKTQDILKKEITTLENEIKSATVDGLEEVLKKFTALKQALSPTLFSPSYSVS